MVTLKNAPIVRNHGKLKKIWLKQPKAASALDFSYFQRVSKLVMHDRKTAVFVKKTAVFATLIRYSICDEKK